MGLGLSGGAWWRTVATLSRQFRVITFDNRGVGRSRGLTPAYTTEALADDAAAVLDAVGVATAHVYGLSLGGMVAQQLAFAIHAASLAGARGHDPRRRRAHLADDEVMAFFSSRSKLSREEAAWASVAYNYGQRCRDEHADRIAEDIRRRLAYNFDEAAYQAQLMAAALHNCTSRLGRIDVPALVIHGEDDRVVPVGNAHLIGAACATPASTSCRAPAISTRPRRRRPTPRWNASSRRSPRPHRCRPGHPWPVCAGADAVHEGGRGR